MAEYIDGIVDTLGNNLELVDTQARTNIAQINNSLTKLEYANSTGEISLDNYSYPNNFYDFPHDGYIIFDGGTSTNGVIRVAIRTADSTINVYKYINITAAYQIDNMFVKKGMRAAIVTNTTNGSVKYVPLDK